MSQPSAVESYDVVADFRLVHAPMLRSETAVPNLGHAGLRAALTERLQHSSGGAFLIGGFRGAGKTTLVGQAVDELVATRSADRTWVPVRVDVAHPLSPTDLLYTVMRRLYETLDDRGLLGRLDAKTRDAISVSYLRTSASVATRREQSRERSAGLNLSGLPGLIGKPLGGLAPTFDISSKKSESLGTDVSFLTYGDNDVEHDLLRIVDLLRRATLRSTSWWGRRRGRVDPPVHVIVCLDELDKLTDTPAGAECLNEILVVLKNVLGAGNLHFLLIAGTDLLDRALLDSEHGNGLFESVFAWTAYVPCLWQAPSRLVDSIVQPSGTQDIERLRGYFQFKARGIPRRLLFELNSMVRWVGGRPQIRLDALDRLRVEFYARLNDVLESYIREQVDVDDEAERHGVEHDRFRLGAHYVIDWVLRSEGAVFVATDLIQGRRALSSLLDLAEADVAVLLEHLATEHILDRLNEPQSLFTTFIAGSPTTGLTRYRLDSGIRDELKQLTQGNRRERADLLGDAGFGSQSGANGGYSSGTGSTGYPPSSYLLPPPTTAPYAPPPPTAPYAPPPSPGTPFAPPPAPAAPSAPSWDDVPPAPASPYVTAVPYGTAPAASETAAANFTVPRDEQFVGQGRYQLLDVIGTGGMGMVYRARVVGTDQQVAVKMLPPWAVQDSGLRQRFLRETETSRSLQVPGVVATLDVLDEPGGRLGIVMELAEGTTLQRIADDGTCSPAEAVRIVAELLATVARLHAHGLVRLDIKPSNIVLDPERHPIVLDLGLAKPAMAAALSQTTNEGDYVGTPAFSAPEQLRGEAVDQRVDIYACGCVLFQLFGGDLAQGGADVFALMHRRISQAHLPVEDLTCSPELRTVIATATAQRPEHRFQSADAFREKLVAVPEATAEERPVREVPSIVE